MLSQKIQWLKEQIPKAESERDALDESVGDVQQALFEANQRLMELELELDL
jgi:chromosome segregation ATPase